MVCFTEDMLIEFMNNTEPTHFGYRVADFYDWLGRKSRIPSYYKMKNTRFQFEKDKLADRIDRRIFNEFRITYVEWVRYVFSPFLNRNKEKVLEAVSGRWGFVIFFRYQGNKVESDIEL